MITVEAFTHIGNISGLPHFKESDIAIVRISGDESISKEDFYKISQSVMDIETSGLDKHQWYSIVLKREKEGIKYWFDLVSISKLMFKQNKSK